MPKVTDEYKEAKKQQIIDALLRVNKQKSLLAITMQDIINESGLCQGNIYRYYCDIDEIIAKLLSDYRNSADIKPDLEQIFLRDDDFKTTLNNIMKLLSNFMEQGMENYCKLDFEFNSMSMNYPDRALKILSMVDHTSESNLGYLMESTIRIFKEKQASSKIRFRIPPQALLSFISASYEGIQMTALQSYYGNKNLPWEQYRPSVQMQVLGEAINSLIIQE